METDAPSAVPLGALGGLRLPPAAELRSELGRAAAQLSFCELASSAQWAAELCVALPQEGDDAAGPGLAAGITNAPAKLCSSLALAKAHFCMREYARAAHALQPFREELHNFPAAFFLRHYALYLSGEKRREEELAEVADPVEKGQVRNLELGPIEERLAALHAQGSLDGFGLYLYGVALRGLELKADACRILLNSVREFPWNWSAWLELVATCAELYELKDISNLMVPEHWMSHFFRAALHVELQDHDRAKVYYEELRLHFPESSYVLSQLATCHYNLRNFDASQLLFDSIRKHDPFKLTSLDTYSNILYVKEQAAALSHLARQAVRIDKYTPEACCIVGNYYSLKGEHEKSVTYFQRALSLNRNFAPAWILMGHEFMEMRNAPAAIDAYRTAVHVNQRDYRAWYGLGQTYELLNLHFYALFYYRRAMTLRPDDARMWCAMAQCYDVMGRKAEALRCYEKAHRCGDRERMALPRLARLHQELGDRQQAAAYYAQVLAHHGSGGGLGRGVLGGGLSSEAVEALKFMMHFHREEGRLADCEACAARLLDTAGPERDEAKAVLRELRAAAQADDPWGLRSAALGGALSGGAALRPHLGFM